jgi:hypothetical protein
MVIGGYSNDGKAVASVECYDAQWRALPDMSIGREAYGGACVEGLVYVVGGYRAEEKEEEEAEPVASVECYDPSTGDWRAMPDMSVERADCAAACIDGLLYVVGGYDNRYEDDAGLPCAECYDPSTGAWRALPDMSVSRYRCAAASIGGLLYVVGGEDDHEALASAECYDPSTSDWRALPDMSVKRCWCAAACVDGLLYVVGGADSSHDLKRALASVECFDPSTGAWRALPDMSVARYQCAAASIGGLLYVVGGEDALGRPVASAECYDPLTQQWRSLPDMSVARASCVAVALP